jgi:hypothetical protein
MSEADVRLARIIRDIEQELSGEKPPLEKEPPRDQTRYWYMLEAMGKVKR